jgi:CBS domain-containing protein
MGVARGRVAAAGGERATVPIRASAGAPDGSPPMRISDLMTRDVATLEPDATAFDAAHLMWDRDCGFLPVVHPLSRKVIGIVTDRDVCMASWTQGLPLREIPVSRIMSRSIITCSPGDDLERAHARLRGHQVHRLPVVDESERIVGVISLNDLARHAVRQRGPGGSAEKTAIAETLGVINTPRAAALTI